MECLGKHLTITQEVGDMAGEAIARANLDIALAAIRKLDDNT